MAPHFGTFQSLSPRPKIKTRTHTQFQRFNQQKCRIIIYFPLNSNNHIEFIKKIIKNYRVNAPS